MRRAFILGPSWLQVRSLLRPEGRPGRPRPASRQSKRQSASGARRSDRRRNDFTYSEEVAPLLADRCAMCHHPGGSAPFSLLTYADAKRHAAQIAKVTADRIHAPVEGGSHRRPVRRSAPAERAEIRLLRDWAEAGAPEGELEESRPPHSQPHRWTDVVQLGTGPDHHRSSRTRCRRRPDPFTLRPPIPVDNVRFVRVLEFRPATRRSCTTRTSASIHPRGRGALQRPIPGPAITV